MFRIRLFDVFNGFQTVISQRSTVNSFYRYGKHFCHSKAPAVNLLTVTTRHGAHGLNLHLTLFKSTSMLF